VLTDAVARRDLDGIDDIAAVINSRIREVLESPVYVVWRDENGYLELKFHPSTGILIEVVLTSASGLIVEEMSLSPLVRKTLVSCRSSIQATASPKRGVR
jgi:hypothetical protein